MSKLIETKTKWIQIEISQTECEDPSEQLSVTSTCQIFSSNWDRCTTTHSDTPDSIKPNKKDKTAGP